MSQTRGDLLFYGRGPSDIFGLLFWGDLIFLGQPKFSRSTDIFGS